MARSETPTEDQTALRIFISVDIVIRRFGPVMGSANENHSRHSTADGEGVDYEGAVQEILKDVFGE